MADDQTKAQSSQNNVDSHVPERPLDPTTNAQDMFGDTAGMTGVTQGGKQQSSAEPEERVRDTTMIHGGVIQNPVQNTAGGYPKSDVGTDEYNQQVQNGMSSVTRSAATDDATEPSNTANSSLTQPQPTTPEDIELTKSDSSNTPNDQVVQTGIPSDFGKQTVSSPYTTTQDASYQQPENTGEQSASGTTPDPRSDDDALSMAQQAGFQINEDPEHPQPVDAARDIDTAEQSIKSS